MKLTKAQTKSHSEAIALANCGRILTLDERRFVWSNFHPGAESNIGDGGQFFTPWEAAWECAVLHGDEDGHVLDFCAGIGVLAGNLFEHNPRARYTCVEMSAAFVEIGRKAFPEADWICADAYSDEFASANTGRFTSAISNPPFGRALKVKTRRELVALPIIAKLAPLGATLILPSTGNTKDDCAKYTDAICKGCPGWIVQPTSTDLQSFGFKETGIKVQMFDLQENE